MIKKFINILIFFFIFTLYFISFLMIYDNFREKKLASVESNALDVFDNVVKVEEKETPQEPETYREEISYEGYTILGKVEIPKIGFTSVILKDYTYNAMNVGVIKSYGEEINQPGGFILSGHNFRGSSLFMYNIYRLQAGDKIYITDTDGIKLEYTVYETLRYVDPNDTSYYTSYEGFNVTLVTCEDGGQTRIVVKARS